jgi:YbbR domain-containing protein
VRTLVGFVVRNWPLKLAAILLATLLYAGLIVSASAETFQGRIPVQVLKQPDRTFVLGDLPDVTTVRYFAIGTDRPQVTSSTFTATIDLSNVQAVAGAPPVSVPVVVQSVDPALQVIDFSPSRVAVRLDPLVSRDVPVRVDIGTVPPGLDVREPVVSQPSVTVVGPDSAVRFVTAALAQVRIDPSGLDVNETVGLKPIDASGAVVAGVDVQPSSVRVTIQIGSQLATRTLPVNPVVTGTPDPSVQITSVTVQPVLVTVEGEADALAGLVSIDTRPVAVAGATADVVTEVGLALPKGVAAIAVDQVRVTIAISPRSGTRTFEAGTQIVNGNPDLEYQPAVDRVLLTLGGTLAALDAVDPSTISARLDVAGIGPGTIAVPVTVRLPAGVSLVSASPKEVTVTATPIATPGPTASPGSTPALTPTPTPTPAP